MRDEHRTVENVELEQEYPRNMQLGITITLVLLIGLFLVVRGLEVSPYHPSSEFEVMSEEVDLVTTEVEEPPPPPKPKVEVEEATTEEEAEEEDVEIAPTTEFNELEAPPPPTTQEAFEFYAVEVRPQVIKRAQPRYPELARKAGIEGRVMVRALVDESGNVIRAQVLKSDNEIFNEAALEAAKKFKFKPGMQRDRPVKVWVMIPFIFRLQR